MTGEKENIYLEVGQKKLFAAAIDWPGWCRHGRDEAAAVAALLAAAPRYARLLKGTDLAFTVPKSPAALNIVARVEGSATTDFGAPDRQIESDNDPFGPEDLARTKTLLTAFWRGFDAAVETAVGHELRKGPRGGGRDLIAIVEHVMGSETSYLRALGWKYKEDKKADQSQNMSRLRQEIFQGLAAAVASDLPQTGPRDGKQWPPRYFIRRSAWHVIDHIWEIEDRLL